MKSAFEKTVNIIDTVENRSKIIDKLVEDYGSDTFWSKYASSKDDVIQYMQDILQGELTNLSLYELLLLANYDLDTIVWQNIFDCLVNEVCEKVKGADEFFSIGREATLNGDKWYDEYNGLFYNGTYGIIPENPYKLCAKFLNKKDWNKLVEDTSVYVADVFGVNRFKWVAYSNDGSYEDFSEKVFKSKEECYNDMRNAALSKMKWNTEYNEDFETDDAAVNYKVRFTKNMIIHESFSGVYVYKIAREYEEIQKKDIFTYDFKDELIKLGFSRI